MLNSCLPAALWITAALAQAQAGFRLSVEQAPAWTALFKRSQGWTGADGVFSIPLSGYEGPGRADRGKTLFVFSDTFIGEVDSLTGARRNSKMISNSLAVLEGGAADPARIRFLWNQNDSGKAAPAFAPATPNGTAHSGCWYWLQDGFRMEGNVYLFTMLVEKNPSGPPGFQFRETGVTLLKIPLGDDSEPDLARHTQRDMPLYHESDGVKIQFGAGIMANTLEAGAPNPDGYIYVYGRYQRAREEIKLAAARVAAADFEDGSRWSFWDGMAWSPQIASAAPLGRGGAELSVMPAPDGPLAGKYLLVSMQLEREVFMRVGDSPVGPFGDRIDIYRATESEAGQGVYTYNAKVHPSLSASGGDWLLSYNVNTTDLASNMNNADLYHPRFIKLKIVSSNAILFRNGKGFTRPGDDRAGLGISEWFRSDGRRISIAPGQEPGRPGLYPALRP